MEVFCDMAEHRVILLLASNIRQEEHLSEAHRRLSQMLFDIRLSRQLWSEPYNNCSVPANNHLERTNNCSVPANNHLERTNNCSVPATNQLEKTNNCLVPTKNQLEETDNRSESDNDSHAGMYLNQLVYGTTMQTVDSLQLWLKLTEREMGRTSDAKLMGQICIDIDILEYDGVRYHLKDWERDYVKNLL